MRAHLTKLSCFFHYFIHMDITAFLIISAEKFNVLFSFQNLENIVVVYAAFVL